jgi:hypothetical protein
MLHHEIIGLRTELTDVFRPLPKAASVSEQIEHTDEGEGEGEGDRERQLRNFCCRIYGWSDDQARIVDDVMSSLLTAVARCAVIALRGEGDLVPIAYALHRQLLGPQQRFVVCDPRRGERESSARLLPNRKTGALALGAAAGGSVCIRSSHLPSDYELLAPSRRIANGTQLFVCLHSDDQIIDMMCPPIRIASLAHRVSDLGRLVSEYLADATRALDVGRMRIPARLHNAIMLQTSTLADLEKVVTRIAALKSASSISRAAERLGMAPVSLTRWARRRGILAALEEVEWDRERDRSVDPQHEQNGNANG